MVHSPEDELLGNELLGSDHHGQHHIITNTRRGPESLPNLQHHDLYRTFPPARGWTMSRLRHLALVLLYLGGDAFPRVEGSGPLRDRIIQLVCDNLGVNPDQVTPTLSFADVFGTDSLDVVELVMELEESFDTTIADDEAQKIKTVGDIIDYLARRKLWQTPRSQP